MSDTPPVPSQRVVVTDFDMPFGSMVNFIFKWALAAIPAAILLGIIGAVLFAFLTAALSSAYS